MEHSREVCLLCPDQRLLARWQAFAWKRCCWWDQLIFYPAHYRPAFACSLIPDPPPHRRFLRTRCPPQWCMRKGDCGPGHPKGRVHQQDQQGEGRASEPVVQHPWQGSACPLRLTTHLLVQAWHQLLCPFLACRTSRPFRGTSVGFDLIPCVSSPLCCWQSPCRLTLSRPSLAGRGHLVPRASDTVACRGGKLLTEQEVTAISLLSA